MNNLLKVVTRPLRRPGLELATTESPYYRVTQSYSNTGKFGITAKIVLKMVGSRYACLVPVPNKLWSEIAVLYRPDRTTSSAIAEGPRDALVSRNFANTKCPICINLQSTNDIEVHTRPYINSC